MRRLVAAGPVLLVAVAVVVGHSGLKPAEQ